VIGAETDRRVATMEVLKTAVVYKDHWDRVLAERARSGATGPEPVPHPDDVIIDSETGEVRYDGPVNEEQKAAQKRLRANWPGTGPLQPGRRNVKAIFNEMNGAMASHVPGVSFRRVAFRLAKGTFINFRTRSLRRRRARA
jgi:hypothetical protein